MQTFILDKKGQSGSRTIPIVLSGVVLLALLVLYVSSFQLTLIDDAFIQFQYAKTLASDLVWGFYAAYPCNTATSPLNVMLTAFFMIFTRDAVVASVWFTALQFLAMFFLLRRICEKLFGRGFLAVFPFAAILTNPLLLSTLGLETTLFALLLLVCLWLYLERRWSLLAIAAGLLTLARFDGFLFFVCLLVAVREKRIRFLVIYAATILPWHFWSWIYLGSVFADTLIIKTRQRMWEAGISFFQGLWYYYFPRFTLATTWSFVLAPFAFFGVRASSDVRKSISLLMGFALFHYGAYSLLIVPPYHWYYGPLAFCVTVSGSLGILSVIAATKHSRVVSIGLAITIVAGIFLPILKEGFPLKEAPIHTNAATHARYKEISLWVRQNTEQNSRFALMGEIGTMGYYSDRVILSSFSFPVYVNNARKKHRYYKIPVLRTLMQWNFYWRKESGTVGRRDYLLRHRAYPHEPVQDPRILKTWDTSTKWFPAGRMYFEQIGKKR